MKNLISSKDTSFIAFELYHPQNAFNLNIRPLPYDQNGRVICEKWEACKSGAIKTLNAFLRNDDACWSTACIYLCGKDTAQMPTLVVKINGRRKKPIGRAFANWASVRTQLCLSLRDGGLPSIDVEFDFGTLEYSAGEPQSLTAETRAGDSIGVWGSDKSGSAGGFLGFKSSPSAPIHYGIVTCHHVTRNEPRGTPAFDDKLVIQPANTINARATKMRSPSKVDFEATEQYLNTSVQETQEAISDLQRFEKQGDFLVPTESNELSRLRPKLLNLQADLALLGPKNVIPGTTVASSGYRIGSHSSKMDWAIVEVPLNRFASNVAPNKNDVPYRHGPGMEGSKDDYKLPLGSVGKIASIKPGDWLIMRGRASGYSTGIVNAVDVSVNCWPLRNWVTTDVSVLGTLAHVAAPPVFGRPGDSGSWVYNKNGEIVGLQISAEVGAKKWDFDDTIISRITHVLEDMERVTNGRVFLPVEGPSGQRQFTAPLHP